MTSSTEARPTVIFVDVDDTLVRSVGTKRIPIPAVIAWVRRQAATGAALYCWSSGGADYARNSARELGIESCFRAFLPKPTLLVDDVSPSDWPGLRMLSPLEITSGGEGV